MRLLKTKKRKNAWRSKIRELKNIWKSKMKNRTISGILIRKISITLVLIVSFRILELLSIPGVRLDNLELSLQTQIYLKNVVGISPNENLTRISIFVLNISPYVNAGILINLSISILKKWSKFKKKDDQKHKKLVKKLTFVIEIGWTFVQSYQIALCLKQVLPNRNRFLVCKIIFWLTTGVVISRVIGGIITNYGLGNGSSILVFSNTISKFLHFFKKTEIEGIEKPSKHIVLVIIFLALSYTFLKSRHRKIQLTSPEQSENSAVIRHENHIPLRFDEIGITPIILTNSVIKIFSKIKLLKYVTSPLVSISYNIIYCIVYFKLILEFNLLYSKAIIDPTEISKQLQKADITVPGVRPGTHLTLYLEKEIGEALVVEGWILAITRTIPLCIESVLNIRDIECLDITSIILLINTNYDIAYEIKNIGSSNKYLNFNKIKH